MSQHGCCNFSISVRIRLSFWLGLWILPILKSRSPVSPIVSFVLIRFRFKDFLLADGRILLPNPTRSANWHTPIHTTPHIKGDPQTPTSNLEPSSLWGLKRRWRRNYSSICGLLYSISENETNFWREISPATFHFPYMTTPGNSLCLTKSIVWTYEMYTQHCGA